MPVYEYRCKSCGETHEIEHGYNDDRPTKCPACGGQLIRVFHPIGVVFKGSGFHKTDYGKSGVRAASSDISGSSGEGKAGEGKPSEGKPAEGKSGESKSTGEKSGDSKSGESKSGEGKQSSSKSADAPSSSDSKPAKAP
jgi:putative FmdB family regulatory protein